MAILALAANWKLDLAVSNRSPCQECFFCAVSFLAPLKQRVTPFCSGDQGMPLEHAMNRPEKVIYTAKVHTTGGRVGASRSDDGRLELKLSRPGTPGAGRSSCSRPAGRPATSRRWNWWRAE